MTASPEASRNLQRQRAVLLLLLGVALGAIALIIAFSRGSGKTLPLATADENGIFPVASLFDVDNAAARPDAGHPAPNFAIHLPDGALASLDDYRGRPIIINFWATWCPPCRREMPDLVKAYAAHRDEGLVILEVNDSESHEAVAEFVQAFGMDMPVIIDPRGEVMRAYSTQSLPSSFFIDRDGVIQVRWIGYLTPDLLDQSLQTIL